MGRSERMNAYIDPTVELLRPISGIAWIPLGLFIFGNGDALPVFIMTYVAFFPLLLNTVHGVSAVDRAPSTCWRRGCARPKQPMRSAGP